MYCAALGVRGSWGAVQFTDDIIFATGKQGIFQVIALVDTARDAQTAKHELLSVADEPLGMIVPSEATIIMRNAEARTHDTADSHSETTRLGASPTLVRLAAPAEFASRPLCQNRPEPIRYDEVRIFDEVEHSRFVIVRPDMFTFACCADVLQLRSAIARTSKMFS